MSNRKKIKPFRQKLAPGTTPEQIAALIKGKAGLVVLEHRHDADCPGRHDGRGCTCTPDVELVAPFGLSQVNP